MKQRFTYGVVHIGSVHTSLLIASFAALDDVEIIERVRKETRFGEEVFRHGRLSFDSIRELCRIPAAVRSGGGSRRREALLRLDRTARRARRL